VNGACPMSVGLANTPRSAFLAFAPTDPVERCTARGSMSRNQEAFSHKPPRPFDKRFRDLITEAAFDSFAEVADVQGLPSVAQMVKMSKHIPAQVLGLHANHVFRISWQRFQWIGAGHEF